MPVLAVAVLKTNNDVAGLVTGLDKLIACKAIRGINTPKLGVEAASMSKSADG